MDVQTAGEIVEMEVQEMIEPVVVAPEPRRLLSRVCYALIPFSDRDAGWRPGIPGTAKVLNERVQDVLHWNDVHPVQRGRMAAALIEEKVRQAYHQALAP